jgi:radical SAM enzyme (TIGR01210 family)
LRAKFRLPPVRKRFPRGRPGGFDGPDLNPEGSPTETPPYPDSGTRAGRDAWILARREGIARNAVLDPRRPSHWLRESEPDPDGGQATILTVFLTNRECPWRCLMCDLWRHTLEEPVPEGAIPEQVRIALDEDRRRPTEPPRWLKLYNAGSFFDAGAIPRQDLPAIAQHARAFKRLVVECHPGLVRDATVLPFREALGADTTLELALGLETAHPGVLERLNKGVDLEGFRRAAEWTRRHGLGLRVFVLVRPPFLDESEALDWACRSIGFAFDCGAQTVSLIPTRAGNGALEWLAARGQFAPPRPETLEAALAHGLSLGRGRVFADTWDLDRLEPDPVRRLSLRQRLEQANRTQQVDKG